MLFRHNSGRESIPSVGKVQFCSSFDAFLLLFWYNSSTVSESILVLLYWCNSSAVVLVQF